MPSPKAPRKHHTLGCKKRFYTQGLQARCSQKMQECILFGFFFYNALRFEIFHIKIYFPIFFKQWNISAELQVLLGKNCLS